MRKNSIVVSSLLAASVLAVSTASGAVLVPGANASLTGWNLSQGGSQIYSKSFGFTAIDVPQGASAATGTLVQTIDMMDSGERVFGLRLSQFSADEGVSLTSLEMAGWTGFSVDADFMLGSGIASPGEVARSGFNNGGNLLWSAFSGPMSDGKDSAWMQVVTDALGYTENKSRLTLSFSDGSRAVVLVAAPSAIPSPGAAVLLLGAAGFAVRRRR